MLELPGTLVPLHSEQEAWLKRYVARLCGLDHERFPGSQPVSFGIGDLDKLEQLDYWVCEKSDGVRVLFFIQTDMQGQMVFIIDRHNTYRELHGFFFPHHEDPKRALGSTIIDGELVIDVHPQTKQETLRLLAFDCLVVDNQNVMQKTLDKRYGRLRDWFYKPYSRMMQDHPHMAENQPFDIKVKEITFSYHVEKIFAVDIPELQHGNDGLIYTCVNAPYTPGSDHNILKWKLPSENSIDFKLILRFPPLSSQPSQPDFHAKPRLLLYVWCGDERGESKYQEYDKLDVDDAEWEKMKLTGEQYDDRIVEVHWDPTASCWRMMRFRDDKPNGNHRSVVENIIQSISDGVEKEMLLGRSNAIRNAWKARHGQPQSQSQQQLNVYTANPPHPTPSHPGHQRGPPPTTSSIKEAPRALLPLRESEKCDLRYGSFAPSRWSKVSGPMVIAGMKR